MRKKHWKIRIHNLMIVPGLKSDLKKKMKDAFWLAETYGLFPRNVICETFEGKQIEVQVSDIKTKGIWYSALTDIEKDKLRQVFYICDNFFVSDSFVCLFVWCLTTHQPLWVISVRRY